MTDATDFAAGDALAGRIAALPGRPGGAEWTPARLQRVSTLRRRRGFVLALNLLTLGTLCWVLARALGAGGWGATDVVIFAAFMVGAPWTVMGFWNAALGLWLLRRPGGLASACPVVAHGLDAAPIRSRVAVLMCLRNEDPARAFARLRALRESLDATGWGARFDLHALSDTDDPAIAAEEARLFAALRPALGPGASYRRRARNEGWKAGNIREFLRRRGADYPLFLPLDSDSLMGGRTVLRMVRVMERHPRIGILQSLVSGAPSASPFARLFQFGMRHGMRSYTAGSVWWAGDSCGYWGHNAIIRTAPFKARCRLPQLAGEPPLGGPILSHDQLEAALMRRAGYECRILPVETESFEDNPPTVLDFLKRDHRWCNGNMQYLKLLGLPGITGMSRFQIVAAIAMYFGGPAWMAMTLAAAAKIVEGRPGDVDFAFGVAMFFIMFSVSLAPKVAGWIDVALQQGGVARYGGGWRFAAGAAAETAFSILLAPVAALAVTVFMGGLALGKRIAWTGQNRDVTRVSWPRAVAAMWPQTLLGLALATATAVAAPGAAVWAAPLLAGLTLSIPFARGTASERVGRWMARAGLCATPEELAPPDPLARLSGRREPDPPLRAA